MNFDPAAFLASLQTVIQETVEKTVTRELANRPMTSSRAASISSVTSAILNTGPTQSAKPSPKKPAVPRVTASSKRMPSVNQQCSAPLSGTLDDSILSTRSSSSRSPSIVSQHEPATGEQQEEGQEERLENEQRSSSEDGNSSDENEEQSDEDQTEKDGEENRGDDQTEDASTERNDLDEVGC